MHLPVIAKIEKPQAIDNINEIVARVRRLMVARGDLGVECPLEDVPFLQKQVIEAARRNAKPVIIATQMLESMISAPRSHPGRGLRRRERGARRHGRGDALGRDQRGRLPDRDRAPRWRASSSRPRTTCCRGWPRSTGSRGPAAASSPRRRPRSPSGWARSSWSRSPPAATRRGGCRATAATSPCWPSPPSRTSARSSACRGGSRPSSARTSNTPTRWSARSTRP